MKIKLKENARHKILRQAIKDGSKYKNKGSQELVERIRAIKPLIIQKNDI